MSDRVLKTHVPTSGSLATIRDVAREASVSIATVSKALNDTGHLRQETRDRVRLAADRLGFWPNHLARSLHSKRSYIVGLLSNDSYGRFSIPILEGVESVLSEHQVSVLLSNAADDRENEQRHLHVLLGKRVDGIILTARRIDRRFSLDLRRAAIPMIYAHAQSASSQGLCLLPDDRGGGYLATKHLLTHGRRRLAHITGPLDFEAVRQRETGFRDALREVGLGENAVVLYGLWREAWGHAAVNQLFQQSGGCHPDALVCGSDQIGRGAVDALRERGFDVPKDVAVTGFDNWDVMAEAARPPLTTIDPNLRSLGRTAGESLLQAIAGDSQTLGLRYVPCSLIVRQSCGVG